ncbi:MAG: M3 family metallopeptidase [Pseudomonadota bacterium]
MSNPLLSTWNTDFEIPPFAEIQDSDFEPAFNAALETAQLDLATIADQESDPTFDNTMHALERVGESLQRVLSVFYSLTGTDSNPERERLMRVFSPRLAAYASEKFMNAALFERIETLWQQRDSLNLTSEQQRLLYITRREFLRAGAKLEGKDRTRLKDVKERLAVLGTQFTQNLLADERDWFMPLQESDVAGLPQFLVDATRAAAADRDMAGHLVTLSRSLIVPFLQFCADRELRRKAYQAWVARGANGGKTDNRAITVEILSLREERARLLGYDNFAAYKLETEMAKTPQAVRKLLMAVWEPARKSAETDAECLTKMLHSEGFTGDLKPWDWRYYAEKRRRLEHDLDESALKPYFQLENMIEAAFSCAHRLFGLEFQEIKLTLYHPDVRSWEVTRNGRHVALFIGDYFARSSKRSGAWCSAMRSQQKLDGDIRPLVRNVCNFAKPPAGQPALLSYDDTRTLFHEFGHALHHMLSDVNYRSLSGTSVARDFVELPSQLFEHWFELPGVLSQFAKHAETGEALPLDMRDRLLAAQNYDQGFATVEYVASALVDLGFHDSAAPEDTLTRQSEILSEIGMPAAIGMRHATPHFSHVFSSDGYSSAYYSYMWSEVMDADAFDAFLETGDPFDADTAKRLESQILSIGGTCDAEEAYTHFRGRMPGVEALLKGRGLDGAMPGGRATAS